MSVMESVAGAAEAVALPASLGQERLWLTEQVEPGTGRYNVALSLRMAGPLDEDALRRAVDELAARHESLRTMLAAVEGQAAQVILPPPPWPWKRRTSPPGRRKSGSARRGRGWTPSCSGRSSWTPAPSFAARSCGWPRTTASSPW